MSYNIGIEGLQFYAFHGHHPEEQKLGGKFIADIYLKADTLLAANSGKLQDTADYEKVIRLAGEEMQVPSKLLEQVCKRVLERILHEVPQVLTAKIRLVKYNPPVKGLVEKVYVEMEMQRSV